ncbi:SDR family NAD(P)-dependent oxidoreductase [Streptomyces sp. NPDC093990]|uniref:SDR family NAD(P)-dependent oxidoreductase n=1 Tax=Streptomyces sp. NPDC093990 TaxID=3155306 RepID=UPI00343C3D60
MTSSYGPHGRAALVTGGTRGIGREVARQLADAEALVCVTARDPDVRQTASERPPGQQHGDASAVRPLMAVNSRGRWCGSRPTRPRDVSPRERGSSVRSNHRDGSAGDGGTRVRAAHPGGYAVHDRLRSSAPRGR